MSKCLYCPAKNICTVPEDTIACKRFCQYVSENTKAISLLKRSTNLKGRLTPREIIKQSQEVLDNKKD